MFSWDKILNFDGETGPYVQYTHARACSVLRNAGEEVALNAAAVDGIDLQHITGDSAYDLVKMLYAFPQMIVEASEKYEPSIITRHLISIRAGCRDPTHTPSAHPRPPPRRARAKRR